MLCVCVCRCIHPSLPPSIHPSIYLSIHLSIHLPIYLSIYLSIYLYLSNNVHTQMHMSIHMSKPSPYGLRHLVVGRPVPLPSDRGPLAMCKLRRLLCPRLQIPFYYKESGLKGGYLFWLSGPHSLRIPKILTQKHRSSSFLFRDFWDKEAFRASREFLRRTKAAQN